MTEPIITDNRARNRFEITEDGQLAGHLNYHRHDARITFVHTEVDPAFGGRGLAGRLVRGALDIARDHGLSVLLVCEYTRAWVARHPDQLDLIAEPLPGEAT